MRKLLIFLLVSVMLLSGCVQAPPVTPGPDMNVTNETPSLSTIHIQSDRALTPKECSERGLGDKVVFIHSLTCSACRATKPILLEAASEAGITVDEVEVSADRERLNELAIQPRYVPTTIIGCDVLVGMKQKFEYRDAMEAM